VSEALTGLREALQPLCQSFATDGYRMTVASLEHGTLTIVIEAREGACEECLVPKEVMGGIVQNTLPADCGVKAIELIYPRD
jgi:hypothetical protein